MGEGVEGYGGEGWWGEGLIVIRRGGGSRGRK